MLLFSYLHVILSDNSQSFYVFCMHVNIRYIYSPVREATDRFPILYSIECCVGFSFNFFLSCIKLKCPFSLPVFSFVSVTGLVLISVPYPSCELEEQYLCGNQLGYHYSIRPLYQQDMKPYR